MINIKPIKITVITLKRKKRKKKKEEEKNIKEKVPNDWGQCC